MTKEEKIAEAYGEHWETVKEDVTEHGWLDGTRFPITQEIKKAIYPYETQINNAHHYRPISLRGIETNNGWTSAKE